MFYLVGSVYINTVLNFRGCTLNGGSKDSSFIFEQLSCKKEKVFLISNGIT